jgi:hypothetical protein
LATNDDAMPFIVGVVAAAAVAAMGTDHGDKEITPSQLADAGGNAPVTPHTRHCASFRRVRLMGDDPPGKRI